MKNLNAALWILSGVLATSCGDDGEISPSTPAVPTAVLSPTPCPETLASAVGAACGLATLPLDMTQPQGPTTQVLYARIPRQDGNSGPTLLVNPGGPGGSVFSAFPTLYIALPQLLQKHDLLLIEPRGVGMSGALQCPALAGGFPLAHQDRIQAFGQCAQELGDTRKFYSSAAVASDMNAIREGLGIPQVDIFVSSYGTYLMSVYMAKYPQTVGTVVLDGLLPMAPAAFGINEAAASRRGMKKVCSATPGCDAATFLDALATVAESLQSKPRPLTGGSAPAGSFLDVTTLARMTTNANYAQLVTGVVDAAGGDFAALETAADTYIAGQVQLNSNLNYAAAATVMCNDGLGVVFDPQDPVGARQLAIDTTLQATPPSAFAPFSPQTWIETQLVLSDTCIQWPEAKSAYVAPTVLTPGPVLVVSGELDATNSEEGALAAQGQFAQVDFLTVPNAAHTGLAGSLAQGNGCFAQAAIKFIETQSAPTAAACPVDVPLPTP